MNTLAEIENATESLSPADKQELLLFLATRLLGERLKLLPTRKFSREQIGAWIADDDAARNQFSLGS